MIAVLVLGFSSAGQAADLSTPPARGIGPVVVAAVPMVELKGHNGQTYYDAVVDSKGKLEITDTKTGKVEYRKVLKDATFNQLNNSLYSLSLSSLEITTKHNFVMCMMMPIESSELEVSTAFDNSELYTGQVRTVLNEGGCASPISIFPTDETDRSNAELVKAVMTVLVNESGIFNRN